MLGTTEMRDVRLELLEVFGCRDVGAALECLYLLIRAEVKNQEVAAVGESNP